ncbi:MULTISPECIES: YheC/YheD family protein [Brevibacillus]|uniref:YheC/YheD family endospore coat-associated protein n=1 Tax=Brevibacillus TaxID=55080 RepID=UPI00203B2BF1|nr:MULTISPECIES: YheC/YheD family protein [Brevibacillus]MCM3079431.1 YheC/YheD family protein [Brevibacillus invocatus]MCM3429517.1 YheC/YheD family protein [Brevibacillus invocatus]MDH4618233.1 YheC/YheD family protein [Brevibacillus sp. AY1]
MPQLRSGWLTILPSGKWFVQLPRQALAKRGGKPLIASLGPFSQQKRLYTGLPSQQPGRIRTRINWKMINHSLRIGPILGILTVGEGATFVGNRDNFRDICLSGKKWGALVFVFTPQGINWEKKRVRGFLYNDRDHTWQNVVMPFPHVIYNRIPTRKAEQQTKVRQTLEKVNEMPNVTLFNRCFFDKQELFSILKEYPEVQPNLPDTKKLDTLARFRHFCSEHHFVYLKPVRGKAGEGIMRIEYKNEGWRVQRLKDYKAITRRFSNLEDLWKYVKGHVRQKKYIMQQGIRRARYRGKPFDLRVLVQKDGKGEWGVTGVGIRRAGSQSITTHVPRGGSIHSLSSVLQALFPDDAQKVEESIHQTALTIAGSLHNEIKDLAEMSMDLGLTTDGSIWFFEANAKPEKFDEPAIRRLSLSNLIHYAQYVSRLQNGRGLQAG